MGKGNLRFGKEIFGQVATSEVVDLVPTDDVNFVQSTMKPKYIVACLSELQNQSHSSKPIGVVHTYFGSKNGSSAFEKAGGKHMAMIRNPLNRIRSHMEHKLRETLTANGLKLSFQPSIAEKQNSKSIIVTKGKETFKYLPSEITEYGFENGKTYYSREIDLNGYKKDVW